MPKAGLDGAGGSLEGPSPQQGLETARSVSPEPLCAIHTLLLVLTLSVSLQGAAPKPGRCRGAMGPVPAARDEPPRAAGC